MSNLIHENSDGVFIIAATPFSDNGDIDYGSIDSLIEFYIEHGVSGMTILGMMGEAPKMTSEESNSIMKYMMKRVDGRVPVIVGVSNPGMKNLADLSNASMDAGAAGVMVAPLSNLTTETKIYNYYGQICNALGSDIPVCYQDFPQITGIDVSVVTLIRLFEDLAQIVMLKHEDCPGLPKLSAVCDYGKSEKGRKVSVLVGNGGIYLPQEMARGADGAMTGFAYPEMLVQVVTLYKSGETERAQDIFDAYLPIANHEQQPGFGLGLRKEILRRRGAIKSAAARAPGPKLSLVDHQELTNLTTRLEKRLAELG
ncbi:MAG: dihydrodipicolinate synthase family protein [Blastopirellula sp.]|nr:MAG: dihydrodipicolinate synthase family protein [Blastopirellula sp.]